MLVGLGSEREMRQRLAACELLSCLLRLRIVMAAWMRRNCSCRCGLRNAPLRERDTGTNQQDASTRNLWAPSAKLDSAFFSRSCLASASCTAAVGAERQLPDGQQTLGGQVGICEALGRQRHFSKHVSTDAN